MGRTAATTVIAFAGLIYVAVLIVATVATMGRTQREVVIVIDTLLYIALVIWVTLKRRPK